ncbi:hypothetical protein EBZ80_26980 [bacterium]|nr:hypothetical protein [bacterium]
MGAIITPEEACALLTELNNIAESGLPTASEFRRHLASAIVKLTTAQDGMPIIYEHRGEWWICINGMTKHGPFESRNRAEFFWGVACRDDDAQYEVDFAHMVLSLTPNGEAWTDSRSGMRFRLDKQAKSMTIEDDSIVDGERLAVLRDRFWIVGYSIASEEEVSSGKL